jgi:hypothetical protein
MFPDNNYAYLLKVWILAHQEKWEEAFLLARRKIHEKDPLLKEYIAARGFLHCKLGSLEKARNCLARLDKMAQDQPSINFNGQKILAAYGLDEIEIIRKAMMGGIELGYGGSIMTMENPFWKRIFGDPRLSDLRDLWLSKIRR